MNTSLKGCVQAESNETRWMSGGTIGGKSASATENTAQVAIDVGVQDMVVVGLSEAHSVLRGTVTRQAFGGSGGLALRASKPVPQDSRSVGTAAQVGPCDGRRAMWREFTKMGPEGEADILGHSATQRG